MTQQHTNNTNSNSQSEKPALESSEAGGQSEAGKLYHIDAVNKKTGMRARMTGYPMPIEQCRTMAGKITRYPWRRLDFVEACG